MASEIKENAVEIARKLQRPKSHWDPEDYEDLQKAKDRRDTIQQLIYHHSKKQDWSNLEVNFKRELFKEGDLNLGKITVSRRTIHTLNEKRMKMARKRKLLHRNSDISSNYFAHTESLYSTPRNWGDNEYTYITPRAPIKPPSTISNDTDSTNVPHTSGESKENRNLPGRRVMEDYGYDNPSFLDDHGRTHVDIELRNIEIDNGMKDLKTQSTDI